MPNRLFWFHAFGRSSAADLEGVLREGAGFNPDSSCKTARNEAALQISKRCVYAYLGMTLDSFGQAAVALPYDAIEGTVSPFDTGGLVSNIKPVCEWEDSARVELLLALSWALSEFPNEFKRFPGSDLEDYLNGTRPKGDGPHERWEVPEPAPIWKNHDDWRAWVWEIRVESNLAVKNLHAWTCSPADYDPIIEAAVKHDLDWALFLTDTHHRGGTAHLVSALREEQVQ